REGPELPVELRGDELAQAQQGCDRGEAVGVGERLLLPVMPNPLDRIGVAGCDGAAPRARIGAASTLGLLGRRRRSPRHRSDHELVDRSIFKNTSRKWGARPALP